MITKEKSYEKVEIFPDGQIRVKEITTFFENGNAIASLASGRKTIQPGEEVEDQPEDVRNIAGVVHTQEKIESYNKRINPSTDFKKEATK